MLHRGNEPIFFSFLYFLFFLFHFTLIINVILWFEICSQFHYMNLRRLEIK
ncbi:hypothetical protein SLEP1_g1508 [Rubroshorea leprosula]|uniref:Uncharacterized protein n=1 Tax=Rubroshorea leprosula TaxID=152421 RepID=A0AAV5HE02_9ROSI|nr:hypothetical protein SLEP1_g1508 [Rubroshorea leprosula]